MSDARDPLSLAPKLRQAFAQGALEAVIQGDRPSAPLVVELDPTSFCDLGCPECISSGLLNQGRFDQERLLQLVHEIVDMGVRAVILIGGGEPLLHPATPTAIEILSDSGVQVGITTNGTLVGRHLATIAGKVIWTRVSVDAATAETYTTFRPARSGKQVFDQVIDNMRDLARVKKGRLGFSFLLMARPTSMGTLETNLHEVFDAAKLAKDIGCDYFELKPQYDMDHFVKGHSPESLQILHNEIEQTRSLADEGFAVLIQGNIDVLTPGLRLKQAKSYEYCHVSNLRTLLTSTGAYLCPYYRGDPRARYGDPTLVPLRELWRGSRREEVGLAIQPSRDCGFHCIRHDSNLAIIQRQNQTEPFSEVVADYDLFI